MKKFDFCATLRQFKISIIVGIVSEKLLIFFVSSKRDEGLNTYSFPVYVLYEMEEYAEEYGCS